MKEPVRILSDLHLGHKVSRIERVDSLRPLIRGAGTVIFNGDTWQELAEPWRERSAVMLGELRELCAEEGVDAVFLSGNHDPGWPGCGWAELAGGKIIVTHGDALLFASSPWKREVLTAEQRILEFWHENPGAEYRIEERLRVARRIARDIHSTEFPTGRRWWQRAWDALIPPTRAMRMLHAWWTQGESGDAFCRRYFPHAEILVIGHFHWAGSWLRHGRRVINGGAFVNPAQAQWIEWQDGWLRRGLIDESDAECRMARVLEVWRIEKSG